MVAAEARRIVSIRRRPTRAGGNSKLNFDERNCTRLRLYIMYTYNSTLPPPATQGGVGVGVDRVRMHVYMYICIYACTSRGISR